MLLLSEDFSTIFLLSVAVRLPGCFAMTELKHGVLGEGSVQGSQCHPIQTIHNHLNLTPIWRSTIHNHQTSPYGGQSCLPSGSNVAALQTEAILDLITDEWVINTPDEGAIKWWIGNAAEDGRAATVFARSAT